MLKRLKLDNFRNFESAEVEFETDAGIHICLGQNARGKTNFLESIFLLSFPKSFRVQSASDLVRFGQNHFLVEAEFSKFELAFGYQKSPIRRIYKCDGVEVTIEEYLTNLQTVLFTPEDVDLFNDSPSMRRRFLDTILSQVDKEYFLLLIEYTKILKQRNALLKRIRLKQATREEIKFWDLKLCELGGKLFQKRKELVLFLKRNLEETYQKLSGDIDAKTELKFVFSGHSRIEDLNDDVDYEGLLRELLEEEIFHNSDVGHTTVGPHRDDFVISLNGRLVSEFCSRGEKRSFMLALKMIELKYLEEKSGKKPILLLDDVFSELDQNRRVQLLELSSEYQTVISTVEKSYFEDFKGNLQIFKFEEKGKIRYNG